MPSVTTSTIYLLTNLASDDPFNHTAADNAEWLRRFKRSAGLLPADEGDGLSSEYMFKGGLRRSKPWPDGHSALSEALNPSLSTQPMQLDPQPNLAFDPSAGPPMDTIHPSPTPSPAATGTVFASLDFETKLVQFAVSEVASSGRMPPDAAIQARARELSGFEVWQVAQTPVDDPVLLAQFKVLVVDKVKAVLGDDDGGARAVQRTVAPAVATLDHARAERGLDAIDPGLLPALNPGVDAAETSPTVHVAVSESRLDEIILEALRTK